MGSSASSPASRPISGRLPGSRSPPQPKTSATLRPREAAERAQRRLQGGGGVGVVHVDRRLVAPARRRPVPSTRSIRPGTGAAGGDPRRHRRVGESERLGRRRRGQQVIQVVGAEQRRREGQLAARCGEDATDPRLVDLGAGHRHRGPRRVAGEGHRGHRRRQLGGQAGAVGVVEVDRRPAGRLEHPEQPPLGGEVVVEVAVEVEVVAGQVGEHRGVEGGALDPAQRRGRARRPRSPPPAPRRRASGAGCGRGPRPPASSARRRSRGRRRCSRGCPAARPAGRRRPGSPPPAPPPSTCRWCR